MNIKMMIKTIFLLLFLFYNGFVLAMEKSNSQALVDIKVGIELSKLEASANNIDQSIRLASQALQEMAKHPNINDEQQTKIIETFDNINQLSMTFQSTIKEIPTAINKSTPSLLAAIDDVFSNIQLTIILLLIAIVLILLFALIALYYWILKPTSMMLLKTTGKVDHMATALQTTAKIVEKNTEQQLLILNNQTTIKKNDNI